MAPAARPSVCCTMAASRGELVGAAAASLVQSLTVALVTVRIARIESEQVLLIICTTAVTVQEVMILRKLTVL